MGVKKILYGSFLLVNLALVILVVIFTALFALKDPVDFPVFYGAARNALQGLSAYTYYGLHHLPFWYFPWVSWIFLPLAVFSEQIAWMIYLIADILAAFLSVHALVDHDQGFSAFDRLYMASMLLWIGWLNFAVGQCSFLLLGAAALIILLVGKNRPVLAGLFIPFLLMKPHLFMIFIPLLLWLGGRKTLIAAALVTFLLIGIATWLDPHWIGQWLGLLAQGPGMFDTNTLFYFSTFPTLLGYPQNYLGTANLPFTFVLIAIAAGVLIRFHSLPKIPLLSLALAASVFCAPRSYAYDLVLLIPAMVWLSEKWSLKTALLWGGCALIPILAHFSSGSYLVTLVVFALGIYKAIQMEKRAGVSVSFWGKRISPIP